MILKAFFSNDSSLKLLSYDPINYGEHTNILLGIWNSDRVGRGRRGNKITCLNFKKVAPEPLQDWRAFVWIVCLFYLYTVLYCSYVFFHKKDSSTSFFSFFINRTHISKRDEKKSITPKHESLIPGEKKILNLNFE